MSSAEYGVRQLFCTLAIIEAENPVLAEGEHWTEEDPVTGFATGREKVGNGVAAFADLPFTPGGSGGATDLSIANRTSTTLDVASSTGADATVPAATNSQAGLATAAQVTKLEGIAANATANATDAALRDRSTHTGTQAAGTITGLATVATSGAYADLSGRPTLGTAAATAATDYAPAAQGVTGGNSHDHNGGDGGQIAYSSLSGLPTLGTAAATDATVYARALTTNAAVTAGTNSQGQAVLTADTNVITSTPNNPSAVTLGTPAINQPPVVVINAGSNPVNVFPPAGVQIDTAGANNPYSLAVGARIDFIGTSATQWRSSSIERTSVSFLAGTGTGVNAALAASVGTAGAFVTFNGAGGTPSAINLANGTGLPAAGVSGLGSLATLSALGNITSAGAIGSTANLPIITTTGGALSVGSFGTTANTFCQGNDSRLSDARTPTAHNQAWSTITATPTTLSGYGITDAQPLDADLTSIAALTTAAYGRSQLTLVDAAADTAQLNVFTSTLKGLAPASGGGTSNFLRADGTWAAPGGGGATNLTYTTSTRVIASDTGTDATLPLVSSGDAGLAPASGGGTTNFLRADGTWAAPPGGGLTDGDKGDITVSGSGATWTIDNGAVTLAKQANLTTQRIIGRNTAGSGVPEEVSLSQLLDWGSSTRGTILYRGASGWVGLPPGTAGTFIVSGGAGADLSYGTVAQGDIALIADTLAQFPTFEADVRGQIEGSVVAGTNITITPSGSGATRQFTIAASGGSASAGGSTTQVQYNNGGALAGAANVEIKSDNLQLTAPSSTPGVADASSIIIYPVSKADRFMAAMRGPTGAASLLQPSLFSNNVMMYHPQTGTTGTGGNAFQTTWTPGGTVAHGTPAITNFLTRMRRTNFSNVATTANQQLGVRMNTAAEMAFVRGNAADVGGFFFFARFGLGVYPASTVRLFAGLQGNAATTSIATSDTVANHTVGLWHDTTDPGSGSGAFNLVTRDGTTTTKTAINLANAMATNNTYDFMMYCAPNGTEVFYRLDDIVNSVSYTGSSTTTLPGNTVYMSPQCQMSNGTVHTAAGAVNFALAKIYVESVY